MLCVVSVSGDEFKVGVMESDSEADVEGRGDFLSKQEYNKIQENLLSVS